MAAPKMGSPFTAIVNAPSASVRPYNNQHAHIKRFETKAGSLSQAHARPGLVPMGAVRIGADGTLPAGVYLYTPASWPCYAGSVSNLPSLSGASVLAMGARRKQTILDKGTGFRMRAQETTETAEEREIQSLRSTVARTRWHLLHNWPPLCSREIRQTAPRPTRPNLRQHRHIQQGQGKQPPAELQGTRLGGGP